MNYEKKYKEALENFKKIKSANSDNKELVDFIEYEYPELKESEDIFIEEFRNYIHDFTRSTGGKVTQKDNISREIIKKALHRYRDWLEKQGEQKPTEWSEEDESHIGRILSYLESFKAYNAPHIEPIKKEIDWLKSIKPNHWKPSEEQMEELKYFISFHKPQANAAVEGWKEFNNLESLYNDLKNFDMTQEEKQLLLKDLCGRLPYKLRVRYYYYSMGAVGINGYSDEGYLSYEKLEDFSIYPKYGLEKTRAYNILPYLRPLSSMTEEERNEYEDFIIHREHINAQGQEWDIDCFSFDNSPRLIDWLNAHHFDYRSLIDRSLALEAQEGMYDNIKTE